MGNQGASLIFHTSPPPRVPSLLLSHSWLQESNPSPLGHDYCCFYQHIQNFLVLHVTDITGLIKSKTVPQRVQQSIIQPVKQVVEVEVKTARQKGQLMMLMKPSCLPSLEAGSGASVLNPDVSSCRKGPIRRAKYWHPVSRSHQLAHKEPGTPRKYMVQVSHRRSTV